MKGSTVIMPWKDYSFILNMSNSISWKPSHSTIDPRNGMLIAIHTVVISREKHAIPEIGTNSITVIPIGYSKAECETNRH